MENKLYTPEPIPEDAPFSFREKIKHYNALLVYTLSFWRKLLLAAFIGALIGLGYAWLKPTTYMGRTSFVVEESKAGGGSIMSALAGQMGVDIGGLTGASGVLAGDNVLELVKSQSLIRKTLLSAFDSSGKSLADVYAESYGWKTKWLNSSKVGIMINFPVNKKTNRLQDSLLQRIMKQITEDELSIAKPDKKLGFFELEVTMRNENLCQLFCQRLLKSTIDFYIEAKTRRLSNNVKRLQNKADSLEATLNQKTYSSGTANRMLLDLNPAYSNNQANAEISTREKYMQGTIYAEIVKNLEMSKTALIQETPTIQIVDEPLLPLKKNQLHFAIGALLGAIIALAGMSLFIIIGKEK